MLSTATCKIYFLSRLWSSDSVWTKIICGRSGDAILIVLVVVGGDNFGVLLGGLSSSSKISFCEHVCAEIEISLLPTAEGTNTYVL